MSGLDATAGSRGAGGRETWSSTAGFVLASVGSAVGIGNLRRFPCVVGTNGGGAFLCPSSTSLRERLLPRPLMVLVRFVVPVVLAMTLVARLVERQ